MAYIPKGIQSVIARTTIASFVNIKALLIEESCSLINCHRVIAESEACVKS